MPLIVIFGPFISSALGLVGTAAVVGAALESTSTSTDALPTGQDTYVPAGTYGGGETASPDKASHQPVSLPADLQELKAKLLEQQYSVTTWVRTGLAIETPSGFLKSGDSADVETRKSVQQQNLWRERVFARIADLTGKSPDVIAQTYARLATGQ
jgi:hypothetical protein